MNIEALLFEACQEQWLSVVSHGREPFERFTLEDYADARDTVHSLSSEMAKRIGLSVPEETMKKQLDMSRHVMNAGPIWWIRTTSRCYLSEVYAKWESDRPSPPTESE